MQPTSIALSDFFLARHSKGPQVLEPAEIFRRTRDNFHRAQRGYRDGVCLVPIAPEGLLSTVVNLVAGEPLKAEFVQRVHGEAPRKFVFVERDVLPPARRADVVLYRADVLAEDGDRSTKADWEIISVLSHEGDIVLPLDPGTLIANHFRFSGGTSTNMGADEFTRTLETSASFWAARAEARLRR